MFSNVGTPNNHYFLSGTSGEVVMFGVPILKLFRVYAEYHIFYAFANTCIHCAFANLPNIFTRLSLKVYVVSNKLSSVQ